MSGSTYVGECRTWSGHIHVMTKSYKYTIAQSRLNSLVFHFGLHSVLDSFRWKNMALESVPSSRLRFRFLTSPRTVMPMVAAVLLICIVGVPFVAGETYTKAEQDALAKFRPMVKDILLEDYMSTDEYLIPWLRTKKLDVNAAKSMLELSMQWRRNNKIGTILKEDFTKYQKQFPVFMEGEDKDGRTVATYLFGFYDFRKIALAGEMEMFQRYLSRILEAIQTRIINDRAQGKNVTDAVSIFDMYGFNARQHLCLQCLTVYTHYVSTYEGNYPQMSHRSYLVNVPAIFERVLTIIRPLFSEHTRSTLSILGLNKEEWTHLLQKQIPKDQLLAQFGGTKKVKSGEGI